MLTVKSLSYRHAHSRQEALTDVDFSLAAGESLVVAGRSGSGKSTLLSLLAGLAPHFLKGAMSGSAELDGQKAGEEGVAKWGQGARLMLQNPEAQFIAGSVEEEILLTLRCRGVTGAQADELAQDRLKALNIEDIKDQSVFRLSEGQKQKAVLAALTALRPKILLLDEPSANLDPGSLAELAEVLLNLKKEGLSLIIADHRLYWLRGLGEKLLVLEQGRCAHFGELADLSDLALRTKLGLRDPSAPPKSELPRPPCRLTKDAFGEEIDPQSDAIMIRSETDHEGGAEREKTVENKEATSGKTSGKTLNTASENVSKKTSETTSEQPLETAPDTTPEQASEAASETASEQALERAPDRKLEKTSEKIRRRLF
ncbi:MAG: energy-coupling factor ABC transporter ATP-binding protein [Deltaproteobacteria bacterium]|jgi:energy-coupling factor transporter ATP-binding protein EcfA2|nr:energy-coupling factor ABC transporter ATP-binding protein [Deltaproteobacteria bacterium]